jgi:hypothetical protein
MLASINLIIFKKLNFIEHCIAVTYSYANYLYVFFIVAVLGILFQVPLRHIYFFTMAYMVIYHIYFYKKLFQLSFWKIILKTLLFWLVLIGFWLVLVIIGAIVGFIFAKFILN